MAVREFTGQLDEEYSAPRVREFTGKLDGEVEPQKGPIQAAEDAPDFSRGIGNIIPQIKSTYGAAKALTGVVAQKLGFEDTGRGIMQSGLETMEKGEAESIVKPTDELIGAWEKGGAGAILTDWLPYQMGAGVGNLAQTLGFMAIGAVTGAGVASIPGAVAGAVGRNLIKDGIIAEAQALAKKGAQGAIDAKNLVEVAAKKEVSALARGATAGMVAQSAMQGLGEVGGRAFQEGENRGERPEDVDLARVLPMAGVHAIADFVADKIMLGAFKPITKEVKNGLTLEIGKRILTTGTKELLPEEVQTIAERFGAKLSLTDAGAIRDYINTAGASYAMSVIPGGVGAIRSKLASPVSGDKPKPTEDALIKAGETTTEAGTETGLPLFTPVELPDGTVARSQADLDAFNQNPAAPVGATSASVDALTAEIAAMEADNADRAEKLKNKEGNAKTQESRKNKYDRIQKNIEAKKAELAAATAAVATPAPSADVDGTNLTPGANGQVTPPAAPVPPPAAPVPPAREYTAPEQAAVDLVKAVDAGGVPTDTRKINKIARDLGLEVSTKAKPEETLNRIKEAVGRIDTTQAETSVAPVATEVVKETPKQQAPLPTARAATPEEQNAINHIDAVDAKGAKFSPAQARKVAQAVGIQIPKATKEKPVTTEDINQILREYVGNLKGVLAGRIRQIAPNVFEGTDTTVAIKKEERVSSKLPTEEPVGQVGSTAGLDTEEDKPKTVAELTAAANVARGDAKKSKVTKAGTETKVKAGVKIAKPVTYVKGYERTKEPSASNFLNQNGYYGEEAPITVERGIETGALDEAFDLMDSTLWEKGVAKELKQLAAEFNKNKKAKDRVTAEKPLDFMTLEQLIKIYKKYVGKAAFDAGGAARVEAQKNRAAFIKSLTPEQRKIFDGILTKAFKNEVRTEALGRRGATGKDKRAQRADDRAKIKNQKNIDKYYDAIEQRKTDAEKTERDLEREAALDTIEEEQSLLVDEKETEQAAKAGQEATVEDAAPETTSDEDSDVKAADKIENVEAVGPESSKLNARRNTRTVSAINDSGDIKSVLAELGGGETDYISVMASKLSKVLKHLKITDPTLKRISFSMNIPDGKDGMFDPKRNRIFIRGENGKYTGKRPLEEVLEHEILHYYTDHVVDNRTAYLEAIPAEDRPAATAALNRLNLNYQRAKAALGDKFNIDSLKEFIAEAFSNKEFQNALKNLDDTGRVYKPTSKSSMFREFIKNIAAAFGLSDPSSAVTFKEVLEDIAQILDAPGEGLYGREVSYATSKSKKPQQTKKAPIPLRTGDIGIGKKGEASNAEYMPPEDVVGRDKGFWKKLFTTSEGWQNVARVFQNDRYPIKSWQDVLELAGAIVDDLSKNFNNIYTQITLSSGRAKDLYERHVAGPAQDLDTAINNFAKATGLDIKSAIAQLHMITEAIHEKERREAKYMMLVPLSQKAVVRFNGKLISPATRRQQIVGEHDNNIKGELDNPKLTVAEAKQLRAELDFLVKKYTDETGYSPSGIKVAVDGNKRKNTDIKNEAYNVVGVDPDTAEARRVEIAGSKFKPQIDAVSAALKGLHDATKTLDMQSNYWSKPVSNRVAFYGFENYIPLKGRKGEKVTTIDEMLDFTSSRMGSEVDKPQSAFGGRMSVATNPLLQSMSDATRSALRAGRKNITQSIINAIDQGLLNGKAVYKKEPIPFEQRYAITPDENTIFHYAENGDITLIKITDKLLLNSIRRTYKAVNPLVDIANNITSMIGQFHTRYNYSFGPMNFVRDILTNAFTMGADLGPTKSLALIGDISAKVANGGLGKAMQFIALYNRKDFTSIENLAKKDPFIKDMLDFYTEGGMVTYIDGIAIKSNFEALQKELGRSGIMKTKEQVDKFVDIWTNMFELASRASAYGVAKRSFMADGMAEQPARTKAAAYAKNLANFEQVGQVGKTMGAFYMFFRPAATGAVRAIEALVPAFRSLDSALKSLPQAIQIGATPEAKAQRDTFIKNYKQKQKNARIMTGALFGLGMTAYAMSMAMSPEDELGRNKVMTDNMQQWSRYARFHLPDGLGLGKDVVFQIPWGFGLGAFAAAGAQMAAVMFGKSTVADAAANIALQISLDSFIPIPVSKMNPLEDPLNFALDSIAPSTVRPILEFALNKNGLGQSIYNDSNRRIGDAYVGGDNIPQVYKDIARTFAQITNGGVDWSPNSMYFLANSYADGVSRIFETTYGLTDLASGRKEFNAKTDLPLAGSFFGTRSNVDSREFSSVEKKILAKEQRLNMFKGDPQAMMRYHSEYPMDESIVKHFNTMVNGELKRLRTEAKSFRLMEGISPKEREAMVKMLTLQQNLIKNNIIETFKAYDIKP